MRNTLLLMTLLLLLPFSVDAAEVVKIYPLDDGVNILYDNERQTNWSAARNYSGTSFARLPASTSTTMAVRSDRHSGWYRIYRISTIFDTSSIPEDAVITGASLNLYKFSAGANHAGTELVITSHTRQSDEFLSNADWYIQNYATEFARGLLKDGVHTSYNLNTSGLEYINTGGRTAFGILSNFDFDDIPQGAWLTGASFYTLEAPEVEYRPYLEITYTVPEPVTVKSEVESIESIISSLLSKSLQQSYTAHVKKLLNFFETEKYTSALQQVKALFTKVEQDVEKGALESAVGQSIIETGASVEDLIDEANTTFQVRTIPLITQRPSPYPPESGSWADLPYAAGRSNYSGSCGQTISQCGCALASFAMLGQGYGLTKGVDGSEATPPNIDAWLLVNDGYDAVGNINWVQAIKYFGDAAMPNSSYFTYDKIYTDNPNQIDTHLTKEGPVILKTKATNRDGSQFTHFILGSDKQGVVYSVRDPLWYNTVNLDDVRDRLEWVQDYNNRIDGGRLFTFNEKPVLAKRGIEIHLASPAELILTDSEGRRLGRNPLTGDIYDEIPGGVYYEEAAVYSEELAESGTAPHVTKILAVSAPRDDVYVLEVIGTGSGEYYLSNLTVAGSGESTFVDVRDLTELGQIDKFIIDVETGDGEFTAIIERIRALITESSDYIWLLKRLDVLEDKLEKENLIAAESHVVALLVQLAVQNIDDAALLAELEALKVALGE